MKFLVSGGTQNWVSSIAKYFDDEIGSDFGLLEVLDFDKKELTILKKLAPKSRTYLPKNIKKDVRFTSCTLQGSTLYVGSPTEVYVYDFPSLDLIHTFSHPYFNDVHHVKKIGNKIYVVSTGFDAVVIFDENYNFINAINVLGKDLHHRFSKNIDLRKLSSTKPHESHPNFIFDINGDPHVTRFHQKDAVSLTDISQKFNIETQKIHDGHVFENEVYFTTIDGRVIIFDALTGEKKESIDLNLICGKDQALGWCRSLAKVGDFIYVGFTKLRSTKVEDNLLWLSSNLIKKGKVGLPTRITKINYKTKELIDEFVFPAGHINLLFSIIPIKDYKI